MKWVFATGALSGLCVLAWFITWLWGPYDTNYVVDDLHGLPEDLAFVRKKAAKFMKQHILGHDWRRNVSGSAHPALGRLSSVDPLILIRDSSHRIRAVLLHVKGSSRMFFFSFSFIFSVNSYFMPLWVWHSLLWGRDSALLRIALVWLWLELQAVLANSQCHLREEWVGACLCINHLNPFFCVI